MGGLKNRAGIEVIREGQSMVLRVLAVDQPQVLWRGRVVPFLSRIHAASLHEKSAAKVKEVQGESDIPAASACRCSSRRLAQPSALNKLLSGLYHGIPRASSAPGALQQELPLFRFWLDWAEASASTQDEDEQAAPIGRLGHVRRQMAEQGGRVLPKK
jgi:hypothetical protein